MTEKKPRKGYRKCQQCGRNRAERFFTGPRGRICETCRKRNKREANHDARVQRTYGLGPGEYRRLLEAQGGVCAICGEARTYRLDVDHDHASGLVRGLLCRRCNRDLLPASRNRPAVLHQAAAYLEDPPALRALGRRYYRG